MTPWLLWTAGAALALTGLLVTLRALLADRARGRKRCPKCWYDMSGVIVARAGEHTEQTERTEHCDQADHADPDPPEPPPCPECGRTARRTRDLLRTRRRYAVAALGAIILLAGALIAAAPQAAGQTPIDLIPRPILILLYGTLNDDRKQATYDRFVEEIDDLTTTQRRALARIWAERFLAQLTAQQAAQPPNQPVDRFAMIQAPDGPPETSQVFITLGPDMTPGIDHIIAAIPTLAGAAEDALELLVVHAPAHPSVQQALADRIRTGEPDEAVHAFFVAGPPTGILMDAVAARVDHDPSCVGPLLEALEFAPYAYMLGAQGMRYTVVESSDLIRAILRARGGQRAIVESAAAMSRRTRHELVRAAATDPRGRPRLLALLIDMREPTAVVVAAGLTPPPAGAEHALQDLLAREEATELAVTLEMHFITSDWTRAWPAGSWRHRAADLVRRIVSDARDPDVRSAAVRAIRRGLGSFPDAEAIAINLLESDPDYDVRTEAAWLCTDLPLTQPLIQAMRSAAETDRDGWVRTILHAHMNEHGVRR